MDMIGVIWQVGILSAVLIFGIKLGLATGLANVSKKWLAITTVLYGAGILILTKIASFYSTQIVDAIYSYNTAFFLIMAIIMVLAGIFTIREWKVFERDTSKATCIAVVAPCPCCFGSIIVSILLVSPTVGLGPFSLSKYIALALMITIIVFYFLSKSIVNKLKKPYPIILGNFMLFLGMYFLASALVLPNIASVITKKMGPISIASPTQMIIMSIAIVILIIAGYQINRKNNFLT